MKTITPTLFFFFKKGNIEQARCGLTRNFTRENWIPCNRDLTRPTKKSGRWFSVISHAQQWHRKRIPYTTCNKEQITMVSNVSAAELLINLFRILSGTVLDGQWINHYFWRGRRPCTSKELQELTFPFKNYLNWCVFETIGVVLLVVHL